MRSIIFILTLIGAVTAIKADVVYLSHTADDVIERVGSAGTINTVLDDDLDSPSGLVFDSVGNLYVSNYGSGASDGSIIRIAPNSSVPVEMATDLDGPKGLYVDNNGILYAALANNDTIIRFTAPGVFTTFATLPAGSAPCAIARFSTGFFFVANENGNSISRITLQGVVTLHSSSVTAPTALAFDASGNLFATHGGSTGEITRINSNGSVTLLLDGLDDPRGLGVDAAGNFLVVTAGDNTLRKVTPSQGVTIITDELSGAGPISVQGIRKTVLVTKDEFVAAAFDAQIQSLGEPAVSDDGEVVYKGKLVIGVAEVTPALAGCIFQSNINGEPSLLIQTNDFADGTDDALIKSFSDPVISSDGSVGFRASFKGGDTKPGNASGLFLDGGMVVRKGDFADFDETMRFAGFQSFALTGSGMIFQATLSGRGITPLNNSGLWDESFTQLLRKNDFVTSNLTGDPVKVKGFKFLKPVPFSQGQCRSVASDSTIAVLANLSDTTQAVLRVDSGGATVVAQKKEILITDPIDSKFTKLGSPAVVDGGNIAYRATLAVGPGGITSATNKAIFLDEAGGSRVLIAQSGNAAPGATGSTYAGFSDPVINNDSEIAFRANLKIGTGDTTATNTVGIWSNHSDSLTLVSRQGTQPPGATGVAFSAFNHFVLPDEGGVIILATVSGFGVTNANNQGIWAQDDDGTLQLVIRKGDFVSVGGVLKSISGIKAFRSLPGLTGQSRTHSNNGNLSLHLSFPDGTHSILLITFP